MSRHSKEHDKKARNQPEFRRTQGIPKMTFFKNLPVNQEIHRSTESTDWKTQKKIQKSEKLWVVDILFKLIFWQLHFEQAVICIRHLLLNLWHRIIRTNPT